MKIIIITIISIIFNSNHISCIEIQSWRVCQSLGQIFISTIGYHKSVLKLGRSLAISCHSSPVIWPLDILIGSLVNHGFNCEHMSNLHHTLSIVISIVGHIGSHVEVFTNTMTCIGSCH